MSHFTVMVVTKTPEELEAALQPYHEYECTGIEDEYVVFVEAEETPEEMQAQHADHLKRYADSTPEDFGQFVSDYHGYHMKNRKWGRMTNPNAKWDWYQIGGRWSGFFDLKKGRSGDVGEQSLVSIACHGEQDIGNRVDQARKCDIDFESKQKRAAENAAKKYDEVDKIINGREFITWEQARESTKDIEVARKTYNDQAVIKDIRKKFDSPFFIINDFSKEREDYIRSESIAAISTFAVLYNGEWKEKGKMGWFASVGNENKNWQGDFLDILKDIPDDALITLVDCHI